MAKGTRVFIDASFLLPFISSLLSSFSTVLMCLPNYAFFFVNVTIYKSNDKANFLYFDFYKFSLVSISIISNACFMI